MDCTKACPEATSFPQLPQEGHPAETQRLSDRQAAVMYLHAAELADDPLTRAQLRRRGVQLLAPPPGALRLPRAC
jgi:hypothetical protein